MAKSITLKDVYEVVNRIEDKFDIRMATLEKRVDILEDFKGRVLGMAAAISAVVGIIGNWIWRQVTKEV